MSTSRQYVLKTALADSTPSPALMDLFLRTAQSVIVCSPNPLLPTVSANLPPLPVFIKNMIRNVRMENAVFLTSLAYLHRLRGKLPSTARGLPCTLHRIVIASFLIATKFLQDSPARNRHWAMHSGCFALAEINLMERQLLFLLDFDSSANPEVLCDILMKDQAYMASLTKCNVKPNFIALPPVDASMDLTHNVQNHVLTPGSVITPSSGDGYQAVPANSTVAKLKAAYRYNPIPTPDEESNPFFAS